MTVTIIGESKLIGTERYDGIDFDLVSVREIHKRNGSINTEVRIKRGKRDIRMASGVYNKITIQDDETGRFLMKYNREGDWK